MTSFRLLLGAIILILSGCSSAHHCRKCFDVQPTKTDTLWQQFFVDVPSVEVDTVFKDGPTPKPIIIREDKLTIRYQKVRDTIRISGECAKDSIIVKVPTLVTQEIHTGIRTIYVWVAIGGAFLLALFIGLIIGKLGR